MKEDRELKHWTLKELNFINPTYLLLFKMLKLYNYYNQPFVIILVKTWVFQNFIDIYLKDTL